jgi:type II secretory pathway pseudopilin PulG
VTGRPGRPAQAGFTYLGLLFGIAAMGLMLATAAQVADTLARREREAELLFIGDQFRRAIASYHASTEAGGLHRFPTSLEELLEDRRFAVPRRHLRRLYRDPMTGDAGWGLVRSGEHITGVHSLAEGRPLRSHFTGRNGRLAGAASYRDWRFLADDADMSGSLPQHEGG